MDNRGKNNVDIQELNRSVILRILLRNEVCTRTELAEITGLKQASITKIISGFIEAGIVREEGLLKGKMGRRSIGISLNEDNYYILAVKISRKYFSIAVFNIRGGLIEKKRIEINVLQSAEDALHSILEEAESMADRYDKLIAVGVAVPGPYLRKEGRIALMSEFSGWESINIYDEFKSRFPLPVYIEHDANAGALAEWEKRLNEEPDGLLVNFLASEGIGSGIVSNGKILEGYNGIAGEIGHMSIDVNGPKCICGNRGCLELYCSSLAFAKRVRAGLKSHPDSSLNGESDITAKVIFEHMRHGDAYAVMKVREVGRYIGYGIANIINIYDPSEIVLTDIMTEGGELLLEEIHSTVKERILPDIYEKVVIRFTRMTEDPILVGAAAIAVEAIVTGPNILFGGEKR